MVGIGNFDRAEITSLMMDSISGAVTMKEYEKLKIFLESMSDAEFSQYVQSNVEIALSRKDYFAAQKKLMGRISSEDSAWNEMEFEFLCKEENEELSKSICNSNPSDDITLTSEQDEMLIDLWENAAEKTKRGVWIPSDLFFAQTIPLLDCNITVDERGTGGVIVKYRVVVFSDYQKRIEDSGENDAVNVGAVIVPANTKETKYGFTVIPFYVVHGVDSLIAGRIGWIGLNERIRSYMKKGLNRQTVAQMFISTMETWYGIQIALLHPQVREIFSHPSAEKAEDKKPASKKKRKKVVKYIKKHVIKTLELEAKIYGGEKKRKLHALVWYVIGHWRTYTNGKKVFVRPYWKGKLRELKMNLEDREREIVI